MKLLLTLLLAASPFVQLGNPLPPGARAEVPGLFSASFDWLDDEIIETAQGEQTIPARLLARFFLQKQVDVHRMVLRINGEDLQDLVLSQLQDGWKSAVLVEIPTAEAVIELKVFRKGEDKPAYDGRLETALWQPVALGRGAVADPRQRRRANMD